MLSQIVHFGTTTPVWIHKWLQNDTQSMKWHIRGSLLFFEVIHQISRSHRLKKMMIWLRFDGFWMITLILIHGWLWNDTHSFWEKGRGALLWSSISINGSVHWSLRRSVCDTFFTMFPLSYQWRWQMKNRLLPVTTKVHIHNKSMVKHFTATAKGAEALTYGPQQEYIYKYKCTVHWYTNLYSI